MKTFVVRLFVPAEADVELAGELRGLLEEVGTGRSEAFAGGEQLLGLLREAAASGAAEGRGKAEGRKGVSDA